MLKPVFSIRSWTSGCATISAISLDRRATTSGGVLAGAATPNQISRSKPGTPFSAMVETCGNDGGRRAEATPRTFTLPVATWGITAVSADHAAGGGPVLDHHRLLQPLLQFLGNQPAGCIDTAAGADRHHDGDLPRRVELRLYRLRQHHQQANDQCLTHRGHGLVLPAL